MLHVVPPGGGAGWRSLQAMQPGTAVAAAAAGGGGGGGGQPTFLRLPVVYRPLQGGNSARGHSARGNSARGNSAYVGLAARPPQPPPQPGSMRGTSMRFMRPTAGEVAQQPPPQQQQQQPPPQQQQQQPPQQLTHAPILPLVFQRSAKHFVVSNTSPREVSTHMHAVAKKEGATLVVKPHKATMKLSTVAPPTAPDEACSDVVFKIRVFALAADPTQLLLDFTHRRGSRVIASNLYRGVVSVFRAANAIATPEHDHLLAGGQPGGAARPCRVYTVPAIHQVVPIEPGVALATVKPLLAAAESPCFDQKRASCQLLAKLTSGAAAAAVDEEEEDSSTDYTMRSAIGNALFHADVEAPVVNVFKGLGKPQVHEHVRRCLVSLMANMAHMEAQQVVTTDGTATRRLIEAAEVQEAVRQALPKGTHPVDQNTYACEEARDALVEAMRH